MIIEKRGTLMADKELTQQLLDNRQLPAEWLDSAVDYDPTLLRNFHKGKELIEKHIGNSKIVILIDKDPDGFTSAAITYLWVLDKNPNQSIDYFMFEGKTHGIVDKDEIPECDLLIIPDASSNEGHIHEELNCDILVLDHHEISQESQHATVINPKHPQCEYPNRELSGAGVVYKFLQGVDKINNSTDYEKYIDLAAVSIVADVMKLSDLENKYLVAKGLSNITNPYLTTYLNTDQRVRGKFVDPMVVAFYLVPLINGAIRAGSLEEQQELFEALIGETNAQSILANLISLKSSQDGVKNRVVPYIVRDIQQSNRECRNVIIGKVPDRLPKSYTGLVAGLLSSMYGKPTILYREKDENGRIVCVGSARVPNELNVDNFRDLCNESELFNFAEGHQSAFGVGFDKENLETILDHFDKTIERIDKKFTVDFDISDIPSMWNDIVEKSVEFGKHCGTDVPTPSFVVETTLERKNTQIIGKKSNVLKFTHNGIDFICFKFTKGLPEKFKATMIVKPNINEWMGRFTPQFFVDEMEIEEISKFDHLTL